MARVFHIVRVKVFNHEHHRVDYRRVKARCVYCGSMLGRIVYGSLHVYFHCYACDEWTDLGIRILLPGN